MKRRYERTRPSRRRARFITPEMASPERWRLIRGPGGKYALVDEDGASVLEHWDPVVRRFNWHRIKASPVRDFALVHAYQFIQQIESARPFSDWILNLISEAFAEGVPHIAGAAQPQSEAKELKAA